LNHLLELEGAKMSHKSSDEVLNEIEKKFGAIALTPPYFLLPFHTFFVFLPCINIMQVFTCLGLQMISFGKAVDN